MISVDTNGLQPPTKEEAEQLKKATEALARLPVPSTSLKQNWKLRKAIRRILRHGF